MKAYSSISGVYDNFTVDVPYDKFVSYYLSVFEKFNKKPKLILDLGCGTGTVSLKMSELGFEMIAVDGSVEMLMEARDKAYDMEIDNMPVFLCQKMNQLDLFGTIDACISSLDSINYITDKEELFETFLKVDNFLNPDGLFIFDINTSKKLKNLDEKSFVCEDEDTFLVWQCENKEDINTYSFDIFSKDEDGFYQRETEEHKQRAYSLEFIKELLLKAGFYDIVCYDELNFDEANEDCGRVFFVAKSKGDKKCKIL